MSVEYIFSLSPLVFIAFAAISGLFYFRHHLPWYLKLFDIFLWLMLIVEVVGNYLSYHGTNNQWLYNIFFIVMLIAISVVYFKLLPYRKVRLAILIYLMVFLPFVIVNSLLWQPVKTLQTNQFVLGGTFIFVLAITYFWHLYSIEETVNILTDTGFWFSAGILLYFGVHIPMLGMMNYLWNNFPGFINNYFIVVTSIFSIILNLCFAIGFLCRSRTQK